MPLLGTLFSYRLQCPNCAFCALLFAQPPPSVEHIDLSLDWWRTELSRIEKEIKKNISVPMLKLFLKVDIVRVDNYTSWVWVPGERVTKKHSATLISDTVRPEPRRFRTPKQAGISPLVENAKISWRKRV